MVGVAGSPEKCAWLTDELGFDAAIDYKRDDARARLDEEFPDGIAVRFLDFPVTLQAGVVRLSRREEDGATLMGCEFSRPLSFQECRLLGIRCTERDASD